MNAESPDVRFFYTEMTVESPDVRFQKADTPDGVAHTWAFGLLFWVMISADVGFR